MSGSITKVVTVLRPSITETGSLAPTSERGIARRHHNVNRFRNLLAETGLTQAQLARKLDVHPNTVTNWATGEKLPGPARAWMELYARVKELLE